MNRAVLQQMARERILDAKALLDAGRWEFAYYTAGYSVECALKSCLLARMIHTAWVFEEKWRAQECLTHDFSDLIKLAGLTVELDAQLATSPAFVLNWTTADGWKVTSRYQAKTEAEARALYAAITADPEGVLKWVQNYW